MQGCSRCEQIPESREDAGLLCITSPLEHTMGKIGEIFQENDFSVSRRDDEVLVARIKPFELRDFTDQFRGALSEGERRDVNAIWLDEDRDIRLSDLTEMKSFEHVLGRVDGDWLMDLLRGDGLRTAFHPIVEAEEPTSIHGHECLLRARDENGDPIAPARIFRTAGSGDLMFQLDREARITAVRNSTDMPSDQKIFINFMPTSIYDPEYCLRTTMEAVEESRIDRDQLVFEVVESEQTQDQDHLLEILNHYRDEQVKVALDDMGAGYNSLTLLSELKPDYIKLDMQLVQSIDQNAFQAELAEGLISTARDHGIRTLAEGVETREEYEWFRDHGVDFMQGFLFARPSENPADSIQLPKSPVSS